MAWLRYNDLVEPVNRNPRAEGLWFLLFSILWIGKSVYELRRDWHRHRWEWLTIGDALIALYLLALIGAAARRAWRKTRGSGKSSKTATQSMRH